MRLPFQAGLWLCCTVLLLAGCTPPDEKAADFLASARQHYEAGDLGRARVDLRNVQMVQPRNAQAAWLMALIDERGEDYRAALGNLQLAVDADPGFLEARVKLGNYYVLGNQVAEARVQADAAMAIAPKRASVRLLNARAFYVEGDADRALREAGEALRLEPGRQDAVAFIASLHAAAGRMDDALATTDRAIRAVSGQDAEGLRRIRVTLLMTAGEVAVAEQELIRMGADFPDTPAYQLALARLYASQGRTADAEARVRALVAREPSGTEWRIQLAGLLVQDGRQHEAEAVLREAVAAIPDSTVPKFALAGFYEAGQRPEDARRLYDLIAAADPLSDDGLTARNRLVALAAESDPAGARRLVQAILQDAPTNPDALVVRAAYSFQDGRFSDAVADLRAALARQPGSPRVLLMLARTYVRIGDGALAEDTYRRLLAVAPDSAVAAGELAAVVGDRGNLVEASEILRQATERAPASPGASMALVSALLGQGDFSGAEGEARRILAVGEDTGAADYQLGVALQMQNEEQRAVAAYRAALAKTPTADAPLAGLVQLLGRSGRAGEAEAYLERHVKEHPDHVTGLLLLGIAYRDAGKVDRAQALLDQVVASQPGLPAGWVAYAAMFPVADLAHLRLLTEGHRQVPGDAQIGLALGAALGARSDYEAAIRVYEQVLAAGGDNEFVASNLAGLLLDVRKDAASHTRALALTERFATATHPFQLGVRGWALYRNGQYPDAVGYLERAVAASGEPSPQLRYYLGMAYAGAGNPAGARRELRGAVEGAATAGMTFTGLADARARLRELDAGAG